MLMLGKVIHELDKIKQGMVKTTTLNSPTINDLQDCCVASALECFRSQVNHLSVTDSKLKRTQKFIFNELRKKLIVNAVSTCKSEEKQVRKSKTIKITAGLFCINCNNSMLLHTVLTCAMFCFRKLSANHVTRTRRLTTEYLWRIFKLCWKRLVQYNPEMSLNFFTHTHIYIYTYNFGLYFLIFSVDFDVKVLCPPYSSTPK
ncbi:interleukin-21 isoform X2 [Labeo rohita]|nr:interleukin-21 isoform X2 [Labeo rohita]